MLGLADRSMRFVAAQTDFETTRGLMPDAGGWPVCGWDGGLQDIRC
jgi:hypothetical protein